MGNCSVLSQHIVFPSWEPSDMFFTYFLVTFLGWPHTSGDLLPPALAPGQCLSCPAQGTGFVCGLLELLLCSCTWAQCRHPAACGRLNLGARIPRFCDSSGAEAGSTIPEHIVQALAVVAVRLLYRPVLSIGCWRCLQLRKEISWANHLLWSLHGLGESVQME